MKLKKLYYSGKLIKSKGNGKKTLSVIKNSLPNLHWISPIFPKKYLSIKLVSPKNENSNKI